MLTPPGAIRVRGLTAPARWRAMLSNGLHDLAVLAVLALVIDRDDSVRRRHQHKTWKIRPKNRHGTISTKFSTAEKIWPLSKSAIGGTKTARM